MRSDINLYPMFRRIKNEELQLTRHLLGLVNDRRASESLPEFIEEMNDGGMGSIQFGDRSGRAFGRDIVQVKYIDSDNVPVLITLIDDNVGELFELEFWKVDNNRLINYPVPKQVTIEQ